MSISRFVKPAAAARSRSCPRGERSARPRFVWSTTPVALMTRSSENTPFRTSRATTRSTSVGASATEEAPSRTSRLSAAKTSRVASARRRRGTDRRSGRSAMRPTSASTPGRPRRRACVLSARGKLGLHARADPRDHLAGLVADGLRPRAPCLGLQEATDGLLGQPRPELLEIARREALALEGTRPLARQLLDEAIALGGEAARALDQLGQLGGHRAHP